MEINDTMQADILEGEFEARKLQPVEHFRTRTTANYGPDGQPVTSDRLQSVIIFAYLHKLITASPDKTHAV